HNNTGMYIAAAAFLGIPVKGVVRKNDIAKRHLTQRSVLYINDERNKIIGIGLNNLSMTKSVI
uniref:hypothetical protein n=1 Tax=Candidatus Limisoma sp. TaxID=3076476 RepID=UPI003FEEDFE6